jgi:hypothetical protein
VGRSWLFRYLKMREIAFLMEFSEGSNVPLTKNAEQKLSKKLHRMHCDFFLLYLIFAICTHI